MTTLFMATADATYDNSLVQANTVSITIDSGTLHGGHTRSFKATGAADYISSPDVFGNAGGRVSGYFRWSGFGASTESFLEMDNNADAHEISVRLTSGGVLQFFGRTGGINSQVGSNGSTLSLNTWYRIELTWAITSGSNWAAKVFLNGTQDISVTNANATLDAFTIARLYIQATIASFVMYFDDIYCDNGSGNTTIASDVWVTAKRPFANGTTNAWNTPNLPSSYGSGNARNVNYRPVAATGEENDNAGRTEEFSVEGAAVGDIDISAATLIDWGGWTMAKIFSAANASLIVGGATATVALTTGYTGFLAYKASTTYPAGGTDVGMVSNATISTTMEGCGVMVAYTPGVAAPAANPGLDDSADAAALIELF